MQKNIFVFGLNSFNREKLTHLNETGQYRFHKLIDVDKLKDAESYDFSALLSEARDTLENFEGVIDAIINFWDFPASVIHPILCREYGLPGPSLESVIKCGHKGISRIEQQRVIPEFIPGFSMFDPFAENPLDQIGLDFPFWIKPVLSYSAYLGFRIDNESDFNTHIETIREHIGRYAKPYEDMLEHVELDESLKQYPAHYCLAEEIISSGTQCTVEGYLFQHKVETYGIIDSIRYPNMVSFSRYQYPSSLPREAQKKIREISGTIIEYIGFDQSAFNIEFFYDADLDRIRLLEINSRISQSHADLFEKVDGTTNHRFVVDLGLGKRPAFKKVNGGYKYGTKIFARRFEDAIVTRVPKPEDIAEIQRQIPGATIVVPVKEGERLSDLLDQDSYSYQYAIVYLGAKNKRELGKHYRQIMKSLPFEFELVEENTEPA